MLFLSNKDALNTSLEADLASSEALKSVSLSDSSRIQTLQRSISVHEVAMASMKAEFERQNQELVAVEEEVSKLRAAIAKKDAQLSLLSSIDDSANNSKQCVLKETMILDHVIFQVIITVCHNVSSTAALSRHSADFPPSRGWGSEGG